MKNASMPSWSTHTENEFWSMFPRDLEKAQVRVIIQSPFVAIWRLKKLADDICRLRKREIEICVFLQQPRESNTLGSQSSYAMRELKFCIETLQSWNIHVNLRRNIHGKFAVIDDEILWDESLNILSHANTREHMRRWECQSEIQVVISTHALEDCSECALDKFDFGVVEQLQPLVSLGKMLAGRRESLSLSQRKLAMQCTTSRSRISAIEGGGGASLAKFIQIVHKLKLRNVLIPQSDVKAVVKFLRQRHESLNSQSRK